MRVLIAGSHGKIGQRLTQQLAERGHEAIAMIRKEEQASGMAALGGSPLIADLSGDVAHTVRNVDAVVFTAGAGPGSGPGPKQVIDRGGAEKLIKAAEAARVQRYVMVSAIRANRPEVADGDFRKYLEAKGQADDRLARSALDWTIIRPGGLTEDDPTGRVRVASELAESGQIPRADVAAVIVGCLEMNTTIGKAFDLVSGDTPITTALESL